MSRITIHRSSEERERVHMLLDRGWKRLKRNGQGHLLMLWTPTGFELPIPGTAVGKHLKRRFMKHVLMVESGKVFSTRKTTS